MRIVYNLTENTQIDTIDAMIGRIKLIDELSAHIDDIYDFLADDTHEIVSKASTEQIKEERIKAKQIIEGGLEEKINEAENVAFFKGAIRFLYYSSKTSNNVDWSEKNFGLKLKTAKQYFSDSGVSGKYKENAILLRSLVSHVDFSTRDYGYWNDLKLYFNNESSDTWKRNLLADGLQKYISELFEKCLTEEELKKFSAFSSYPYCKYVQNQLVNTELFNTLDKFDKDCRIRWNWERFVLHPDNTKSHNDFYYVIDKRNELLAGLLDIECEQKVKDLPFYWGKDINFKFCGHYFRYCFERKGEKYDVCLMETGWKAFEKSGENYIGFEVTPDAETSETLKNKLENLKKDK